MPSALTLPRFPAGMINQSGISPIELLYNFYSNGLLSFHAEGIHRVGKIDGIIRGNFLNNAHAAVKIRIQR